MPPVKPRTTEPPRRARARTTQRRIIEAAFDLFCEHGYLGTTMADLADRAGVAVQTVYFTFHTKATILSRAYDFAVMGHEAPLVPTEQPWYRAMVAEPAVSTALRHLVVGVGDITARLAPLYVVARGAAIGDPDVAEVVARHESWRVAGYRDMLEILLAKAPLRPGMTAERANQLLLLFAGMDAYHFLVRVAGWTHEEWVDWTVAIILEQLFAARPEADPQPRPGRDDGPSQTAGRDGPAPVRRPG